MLGLYIHVPFCRKRCFYCNFYSTTCSKRKRIAYVKALTEEMRMRAEEIRKAPAGVWGKPFDTRETNEARPELSTIYFGGGTPSQLDTEELETVFDAIKNHFRIAPEAEITFECNPDDLAPEHSHHTLAILLSTIGVNRISMGVQSFDDSILSAINRRHTSRQIFDAIQSVHAAGIHNISIDLIYGLPGQTLEVWKRDVEQVVALAQSTIERHHGITHVSSYALSIEPGTHLYNLYTRGEVVEINDELSLEMYNFLVDTLKTAGFDHYEISNFALPGYSSRHNSSYWRQVPYLGLGPGACSYDGDKLRFSNRHSLEDYLNAPADAFDEELLSDNERYDELIMTRLRTREGLPLSLLKESEKIYLLRAARPYIESGHMVLEEGNTQAAMIRLTRDGIFISDAIFANLMSE